MGKKYADDAYRDIVYNHPEWERIATDYEAGFAAKLSNDPIVKEAAHGVLTKLSKMLNSYYDVQKFKSEHPEATKRGDFSALYSLAQKSLGGEEIKVGDVLENALLTGRENRGSAGQIGNKVLELSAEEKTDKAKLDTAHKENRDMLDEVINGEGNLREQMTLLYNGFFQNGGRTKEEIAASKSFKNMMANITREDAAMMNLEGAFAGDTEAFRMKPDFDIIDEQKARKTGGDIMDTVSVAYGVAKAHDKKKGRGNIISRALAGLKRILRSTRSGREYVNQEGFGEAYYNGLGLELSERERQYGTNGGTTALQWQEGGRLFKMPKPVTADGMLQVAGSSGTALRMLAAYRMMGANKKDLLYFRLALIGWMCSSRDHSLYEVLKGSHNAGIKGYEDLSDAVSMYVSVDPLSPEEIRENYAPNREYPQETVYKKIVQEAGEARKKRVDEKNKKNAEKHPNIPYEIELAQIRESKIRGKERMERRKIIANRQDALSKEIDELKAQKLMKEEESAQEGADTEALQKEIAALTTELGNKQELYNKLVRISKEVLETQIRDAREMRAKKEALESTGFVVDDEMLRYNLFNSQVAVKEDRTAELKAMLDADPEEQTIKDNVLNIEVEDPERDMETDRMNAQDTALNIYTTSAFKMMNQSRKYGERTGKLIMRKFTNAQDAYLNARPGELADDAVIDKVTVALRLSNRIAQDALLERAAVGKEDYQERIAQRERNGENVDYERQHESSRYSAIVPTMRGGKTPGALYGSVGTVYTTGNLTSTSKSVLQADTFFTKAAKLSEYERYEGKDYEAASIMEFRLTGKSGVDVSTVSQYGQEEEVLLPAGARFKIIRPLTEDVLEEGQLKPLGNYNAEEISKIRSGEKPTRKLRKHVVLEEVESEKAQTTKTQYLKKRSSRDKKKQELQERAQRFASLRKRRRVAGAQ